MNILKTAIISLIVAVVTVSGIVGLNKPSPKVTGATPISAFNYECNAGVCRYFGSAALKTATTTPCAIQAPAATSTLGSVTLRLDTSSTSATVWDIAQASNAFATTTALGTAYAVGANANAFVQASSAPATNASTVLAPNAWVVIGARAGISSGDAVGTGFVPVGRCAASFVTTDQ